MYYNTTKNSATIKELSIKLYAHKIKCAEY